MGPIEQLASHGVLGILCAILLYWVWRKDAELAAERVRSAEKLQTLNEQYTASIRAELTARVVDATNYTKLALDLQRESSTTANRLTDVFDEVKKLMNASASEGREREAREELRARPTVQAPRELPPHGGGGRYGRGGGE